MKKIAGNLILIICVVLFCVSSYNIYDYVHQNSISKRNAEKLRTLAVHTETGELMQLQVKPDPNEADEAVKAAGAVDAAETAGVAEAVEETAKTAEEETVAEEATVEETAIQEKAPIAVDFMALNNACPDIAGWLYCPDTLINYPLVQGRDNNYYLDHLPDGSYNALGMIFLDYRCSGDFSDPYSVVYGHNMNSGSMFGTLDEYKTQSYYDAHPLFYLITPESAYRIDLVAGRVISGDSPIFSLPQMEEDAAEIISEAITNSTFHANSEYNSEKKYIVLSTCSYEFSEARYVVIGAMTEIQPQ